jgi:hypothetical protein
MRVTLRVPEKQARAVANFADREKRSVTSPFADRKSLPAFAHQIHPEYCYHSIYRPIPMQPRPGFCLPVVLILPLRAA